MVQVAGHLFEEGKAGSLVDDRGHFYKPLQRGPRGNRERNFYQAVAAALKDEEEREAQHLGQQNGKSSAQLRSTPLRIRTRLTSIPSFRECPDRVSVQIAQRDESGLLGTPALRDLRMAAEEWLGRSPDSDGAELTAEHIMDGFSKGDQSSNSQLQEQQEIDAHPQTSLSQSQCHSSRLKEHVATSSSTQLARPAADANAPGSDPHHAEAAALLGQPVYDYYPTLHDRSAPAAPHPPSKLRHQAALQVQEDRTVPTLEGAPLQYLSRPSPFQRAPTHDHPPLPPSPPTAEGSQGVQQQQQQQQQECVQDCEPRASAAWGRCMGLQEGGAGSDHQDLTACVSLPSGPPPRGALRSVSSPCEHSTDLLFAHHVGTAAGTARAAPSGAPATLPPCAQRQQGCGDAGEGGVGWGGWRAQGFGSGGSGRTVPDPSRGVEVGAFVWEGGVKGGRDASLPFSSRSPVGPSSLSWLEVTLEEEEQEGEEGVQQPPASSLSAASHSCPAPEPPPQQQPQSSMVRRRSTFRRLPFSMRNALLLAAIPKFYGVVEAEGRTFLELEDLTRNYRRPSIMDIKVGFRTWYTSASPEYIERCKVKDQSTTQSSLGFKICGMQVYRHSLGGYWRASKRWCKTLPADLVDKALLSFAHNENGVRPEHVYGGPQGAIAQLELLETWFELQREFNFYSSSVLILYEGDAQAGEDARVRVRFVDFAHTFLLEHEKQQRDHNFLAGLRAIVARMSAVMRLDTADTLA